jgi:hypothetical protein
MSVKDQKVFRVLLMMANQDVHFTYIVDRLDFVSFVNVSVPGSSSFL